MSPASGLLDNIVTTLAASGVIPGTYTKVTVDGTGRVTNGAPLSTADVTTALGFTPISNATVGMPNGIATLDSNGLIPLSELPPGLSGAMTYHGTWDAAADLPFLQSGIGVNGEYYKVANAGATVLDGQSGWGVGDTAIFNGSVWQRVPGQSATVLSVAGRVGNVVLGVADVAGAAPIVSPSFIGTATAITPNALDNSTTIATTAYVQAQGYATTAFVQSQAAPVTSVAGRIGNVVLAVADVTGAAPLAAPVFTGNAQAVTPNAIDNSTSIATTAFVHNQGFISNAQLQAAGYATTGFVTGQGYLTNAALGTYVLQNAVGANSGVASLDNTGHIPASELPASIAGALVYKGTWNASSNTPALSNGVGTLGNFYQVSTGGGSNLDGFAGWRTSDIAIFNGTTWEGIASTKSEFLGLTSVANTIATGNVVNGVANIDLVPLANVAGTYTAPTLTVDAYGRIVQAVAGSGGGTSVVNVTTAQATNVANVYAGVANGAAMLNPILGTGRISVASGGAPAGIVVDLANGVVAAGSYNSVQVDSYGRVISGSFVSGIGYYADFYDGNPYATFTPPAAMAFGTGAFTIEGWFNTAGNSNQNEIFDIRPSGSSTVGPVLLVAGTVVSFLAANGSAVVTVLSATAAANVWNHFAVVRIAGTTKLYLNGVLAASAGDSNTYVAGSTGYIGGVGGVGWGFVSNLRVTNTAVYNAPFTAPNMALPVISGTQLLTLQNPTFVDNSANALLITPHNVTMVSSTSIPFPNPPSLTAVGDVTGNSAINAISAITLTLVPSGVVAGTYTSVVVDSKGRVIFGSQSSGYGANSIASLLSARSVYTFTGDGATTGFALSNAVATNDLLVNVGGIVKEPAVDYQVANGVLTLASPPGLNTTIWVMTLGSTASGNATSGSSTVTLTGDVSGTGTGSVMTTLANSGVTAGTYSFATVTVDAKGRVTAIAAGTAGASAGPKVYQLTVTFDSSGNITATSPFSNLPSGWTATRDAANQMTVTHGLGRFPQNIATLAYNTGNGSWSMKYPNLPPTSAWSVAITGSGTTPNNFTMYGLSSSAVTGSVSSTVILSVLI